MKFDPAVPKTPEQTSPKFVWVITVSYRDLYHCIKFHYDFITHFCPIYAKIYAQVTRLDFWVLATPGLQLPQDPYADFHDQYVKRRFAQGRGFWGSRKRNFMFWSHFLENRKFGGKFRLKILILKTIRIPRYKLIREYATGTWILNRHIYLTVWIRVMTLWYTVIIWACSNVVCTVLRLTMDCLWLRFASMSPGAY